MGGGIHTTENSCTSAKSIWNYLSIKQIAISVKYFPSALNLHADWVLRYAKDNLEWKLDVSDLEEIATQLGQPTLDPFTSSLCHNFHNTLHGNQTWVV